MTRELKTINLATEEVSNTYEINGKAKKAQQAFSEWKISIQKRADHIR